MENFITTPLNPDLLEILLAYTYEEACVLNGPLTFALRCLKPEEIAWACYSTDIIFRHVALEALDAELLNTVIHRLYTPDENFILEVYKQSPERVKLKGINMNILKYSHLNFPTVEYYNSLYNTLQIQTNNFDPVKLGERIVFVPGTIPQTFEEIKQTYEPLTEDFKLFAKFVQSKHRLDEPFKDMASIKEYLDMHSTYSPDFETYRKDAINFMADMRDPNGLSLEKLNSYQEKYDACVTVTPENCRLYTRGRFIFNMYVELNQHLMKHIASNPNLGCNDNLERIYEFIGISTSNILKNQHYLYLDEDNYPIISELYRTGIIRTRLFPESINYTDIQKLCFCRTCEPFPYTATIYEGNDGNVYVIVSLKEQNNSNFIEFLRSKRCVCMYNLFMSDIEYHYLRLDALHDWRFRVEVHLKKQPTRVEDILEIVQDTHESWFSPYRRTYISMQTADNMLFPERNVNVFFS